ncbi:hypothetical protein V1514DRAFT_350273 [Lipomyces japonicus]|uniref:uncharacterized protein n=1 Tax=Lipomyces japonicus TaxID=56871 RepID=UPI0034CDCC4F
MSSLKVLQQPFMATGGPFAATFAEEETRDSKRLDAQNRKRKRLSGPIASAASSRSPSRETDASLSTPERKIKSRNSSPKSTNSRKLSPSRSSRTTVTGEGLRKGKKTTNGKKSQVRESGEQDVESEVTTDDDLDWLPPKLVLVRKFFRARERERSKFAAQQSGKGDVSEKDSSDAELESRNDSVLLVKSDREISPRSLPKDGILPIIKSKSSISPIVSERVLPSTSNLSIPAKFKSGPDLADLFLDSHDAAVINKAAVQHEERLLDTALSKYSIGQHSPPASQQVQSSELQKSTFLNETNGQYPAVSIQKGPLTAVNPVSDTLMTTTGVQNQPQSSQSISDAPTNEPTRVVSSPRPPPPPPRPVKKLSFADYKKKQHPVKTASDSAEKETKSAEQSKSNDLLPPTPQQQQSSALSEKENVTESSKF